MKKKWKRFIRFITPRWYSLIIINNRLDEWSYKGCLVFDMGMVHDYQPSDDFMLYGHGCEMLMDLKLNKYQK